MNTQVNLVKTGKYQSRWHLFFLLLLSSTFLAACSGNLAASPAAAEPVAEYDYDDASAANVMTILNSNPGRVSEDEEMISESMAAAVQAEVDAYLEDALDQSASKSSSTGSGAVLNDLEASLESVYLEANPSVVYIIVPPIGSGSGFVYSENGYIVTNNHVVDGGSSFEVVFADGERQEASIVGSDGDSDLAVLKVESLPDGVEPLPLAEQETIQVGQIVVAIGNPFGEQGSMSMGIVSALNRSLESQRGSNSMSNYSLPEVIQTDTPINPGNSGGPLLNLDGEVIGVNAAIASLTNTNSGVGYAVPIGAVRQIVPSLISDSEYIYPYMGVGFDDEISLMEESIYGLSQTQGAYVLSVRPGSPADEAGLIAADPQTGEGGDLVIALDDQVINDFSDLNSYLVYHSAVGQSIDVTVLRNGEEVELLLTLGARP